MPDRAAAAAHTPLTRTPTEAAEAPAAAAAYTMHRCCYATQVTVRRLRLYSSNDLLHRRICRTMDTFGPNPIPKPTGGAHRKLRVAQAFFGLSKTMELEPKWLGMTVMMMVMMMMMMMPPPPPPHPPIPPNPHTPYHHPIRAELCLHACYQAGAFPPPPISRMIQLLLLPVWPFHLPPRPSLPKSPPPTQPSILSLAHPIRPPPPSRPQLPLNPTIPLHRGNHLPRHVWRSIGLGGVGIANV